jgi:hypothetical protein
MVVENEFKLFVHFSMGVGQIPSEDHPKISGKTLGDFYIFGF